MPVDLSRIGLEGIETAQRTLNSIANREALASQTAIAEAEEARAAEDRAIDQYAAQAFEALGRGESPSTGEGISLGQESDDPAAVFDAIGARFLRAGAAKRGMDAITAGAELRKKIADTDKVQDDKEKVRLDNMVSAGDWVARNIGENESEYALFLSQLEDPNNPVAEIIGPENVQVLKNTPWSPELANFFRAKAISIKDQASLALTERGHRRMERSLADTEAYRSSLLEINRANLEERRKENARKDKEQGPDVSKAPTGDERKTAQRAIVNNVKVLDGTMPPENTPAYEAVLNMTDDIVGRAKVIVAENKGLTFPEAVEQAVGEAEAAGDFTIIQQTEDTWKPAFLESTTERSSYKRRGRTPENPIPLPKDKSKWVRGRYYEMNGKVGRYGTDFE